jgi:DNA-binding transcriptional LysR family regulator
MDLDPQRLLDLLTIAETGSFTRAAAARRVSQPALSMSMAVLESALGVRLLNRGRNGAQLTPYGQTLAVHAQTLKHLLVRAGDDIAREKAGLEGRLVIGASPLACASLVPAAVARLCRESPSVTIEIAERPDDALKDDLMTGALDLVVSPAGIRGDPPGIKRDYLMRDRSMVTVRSRHILAGRKSVRLSELCKFFWVLPDPQTEMWRHIEALFAVEKVPWPSGYISTNSILALRAMVMQTDCVSVVSPHLMAVDVEAGHVVCIPLRKSGNSRDIVLRTRRDVPLTPLAERMAKALRQEAAALRSPA